MIPFFVADRPMSLRIIKGLPLEDHPQARIGIMAHANTTANFQEVLRQYPCDNLKFCDAVGGSCKFQEDICKCPHRLRILERTIKMCDSGIFTREGATLTYEELFAAYAHMDVEYGVMIDVFRDADATIASARDALRVYEPFKEKFNLVAVAQGETREDYLRCYEELRAMCFEHIAVGGLLQKVPNTARYTQVRDEEFMYDVLETIRENYPDAWLFALGCYHPSRHELFEQLGVWGDYKGWIFKYKKRNETLDGALSEYAFNHLAHLEIANVQDLIHSIQQKVSDRALAVADHERHVKELTAGKKKLKEKLRAIYARLQAIRSPLLARFEKVVTHGLLKPNEESIVVEAFQSLGMQESDEAEAFWENLRSNRDLKQQVTSKDVAINEVNRTICQAVEALLENAPDLSAPLVEQARNITEIINSTEQGYRLSQVRHMIANKIFSRIETNDTDSTP